MAADNKILCPQPSLMAADHEIFCKQPLIVAVDHEIKAKNSKNNKNPAQIGHSQPLMMVVDK